MENSSKRCRLETPSPFCLNLGFDTSDLTPRPTSGTLLCPLKNWEWTLQRRDVGIFQGLSQALQKIPPKLLEDADRLQNRSGLPKPASALDPLREQLEIWWKEAHRVEAATQLGTVESVARARTRGSLKKHLVYVTNFSSGSVEQTEGLTCDWGIKASDNSSNSSSGSVISGSDERFSNPESSKGLAESLGEFLGTLGEYQRVYSSASDREHCKSAERVLDEARWLAIGCSIYLKFYTSVWIKTHSARSMIAEVMLSEVSPTRALLEAEWRRFSLPRFQSLPTPPPSPSHERREIPGCGPD